jgi:5-methylcytosine-specific restriction protein A
VSYAKGQEEAPSADRLYSLVMALADITRAEVLAAVRECDRLGREPFRREHGYGPARRYLLLNGGKVYDSKAIVGVAHGYLAGEQPLSSGEFSGGEDRVARLLRRLGFAVSDSGPTELTADELIRGVLSLRVSRASRHPASYQPITLLWAIGRARRGDPRIASWAETEQSLRTMLERYGRHGERSRPDYPVAALFRVGLWELRGHVGPVPAAHGDAELRRWFDANEPDGGLAEPADDLIRRSGRVRAAVTTAIVDAYLADQDCVALLAHLGLSDGQIAADLATGDASEPPGYPAADYRRLCTIAGRQARTGAAGRVPRTTLSLARSAAARRAVLVRSQGQCENPGCAGQPADVTDRGDPILDVDHIRELALGGPDLPDQMIALCPNCHAVKTRGSTRDELRRVLLTAARERHAAWQLPA